MGAGTTAFLTPAGAALAVGGGIALKAIALTALGADLGLGLRRKRFAIEDPVTEESTDLAIAAIMSNEPQQCYRRLVCDLAAAAQIGKEVKNTQFCEYRFSCPLSAQQLAK